MLDRFILKTEFSQNYFVLFIISFLIGIILAFVNYFIGGNSLFLVALISLALAYPITNYARKMDRKMVDEFNTTKFFVKRYKKELVLFWTLFLGILLSIIFSMSFNLITDMSYQEMFVQKISGNITQSDFGFGVVLLNNLKVAFFTFIISFLVFSGLIFVIVWNASILGYYLYNLGSFGESFFNFLLLFPHALLEIGGYIFAGIAGAILAYRIDLAYSSKYYEKYNPKKKEYELKPDRRQTFSKILNKRLFIDFGYLLLLSFVFILVGSFIETF